MANDTGVRLANGERSIGGGALAVAQALKVAFAPSTPAGAIDPVAFDLYLRARAVATTTYLGIYHTRLLEAAVALAPGLTQAWSALALSLAIQASEVNRAPTPLAVNEALRQRACHAAERALELDASAALAHAAQAALEPICGAFAARETHLRRSLAAAPGDPLVLERMSRVREAFANREHAFKLDPLSPPAIAAYSSMLREVGRVAEADALETPARERWPQLYFIPIPRIAAAAFQSDWPLVDQLLLDVRTRGPDTAILRAVIERVERMRAGFAEAGNAFVAQMHRELSETGTISLAAVAGACEMGLTRETYPIVLRASFAQLFQPGGLLPQNDATGLHPLFGRYRFAPGPGLPHLQRDIRFVQLCAKLGLCDYWVKSDTWPDCAEQLADYYDFKAEVRRTGAAAQNHA